MIKIRKAGARGAGNISWLKSFHTFSFASYYDPEHMGFESLRVINDDIIAPSMGFGTHPHNNMEIITYVLDGALQHKDSMGNGSVIQPGDVQRMSAGSGVAHSEFNASATDPVHLLQIWFLPDTKNVEPSYEQKNFPREEKLGQFKLIASKAGLNGSVSLHQDVNMLAGVLTAEKPQASYAMEEGRKAWVHIAKGTVSLNGHKLKGGDGVAVADEKELNFTNGDDAEVIIFDLKPIF